MSKQEESRENSRFMVRLLPVPSFSVDHKEAFLPDDGKHF